MDYTLPYLRKTEQLLESTVILDPSYQLSSELKNEIYRLTSALDEIIGNYSLEFLFDRGRMSAILSLSRQIDRDSLDRLNHISPYFIFSEWSAGIYSSEYLQDSSTDENIWWERDTDEFDRDYLKYLSDKFVKTYGIRPLSEDEIQDFYRKYRNILSIFIGNDEEIFSSRRKDFRAIVREFESQYPYKIIYYYLDRYPNEGYWVIKEIYEVVDPDRFNEVSDMIPKSFLGRLNSKPKNTTISLERRKRQFNESDSIAVGVDSGLSIPDYINSLITSERQAIEEYNTVLDSIGIFLQDDDILDLQEILSDEQDHLVILSEMYSRLIQQEFPENGDR